MSHRLFREPPDYSGEHAPEVDDIDLAWVEFCKTPWPDEAFDDWRMYRHDLCERAGLNWQELNTPPEMPEGWTDTQIAQLYPHSHRKCMTVRVLKTRKAAQLCHSVFVDSARVFYKYKAPTQIVFVSAAGDFIFNKNTSPQCLILRMDVVVPESHKMHPHIRNLITRYIHSGKKIVMVYDTKTISTDPFNVKNQTNSWVEF